MKTILRKANDRFHTEIDWLNSRHTFSFSEHYDPNWMGFRNLRVINDDYIESERGFPFHPHRNMEIITFMLEGSLRHQDSLGNNMAITPGEIQVMSAGTGIIHSEFSENKENDKLVHLLQIWISPNKMNLKPRYDQKLIRDKNESNFFKLIASPNENIENVMQINANSDLWYGKFDKEFKFEHSPKLFKNLWIHIIEGELKINDTILNPGDAIGILDADKITIENNLNQKTEFLLFELE